MSKLLLALLRRFLTLGAEGEDEDEGSVLDQEGTGDEGLDEMLDAVEPTEAAKKPQENPDVKEARTRAERAEQDLERERSRTRELEARQPRATTVDPDTERENQELAVAKAAGWTQDQLSWIERQHQSARVAREANRNSQSALAEARDLSDKTAFDRLEATQPKLYKAYADRVEKEYANWRAKGQTVPRTVILKVMLGDDIMSGKVKSKTKSAPAAESTGTKVDRGRTPGARSDVNGKGGRTSDSEKRRERLRNTFI